MLGEGEELDVRESAVASEAVCASSEEGALARRQGIVRNKKTRAVGEVGELKDRFQFSCLTLLVIPNRLVGGSFMGYMEAT